MYKMGIGVTQKNKKFEIDPIFAKKNYSTKTTKLSPPQSGIGLSDAFYSLYTDLFILPLTRFSPCNSTTLKFLFTT